METLFGGYLNILISEEVKDNINQYHLEYN